MENDKSILDKNPHVMIFDAPIAKKRDSIFDCLTEDEMEQLERVNFCGNVYDLLVRTGNQTEFILDEFEDSSIDDEIYNEFSQLVVEFQAKVSKLILRVGD